MIVILYDSQFGNTKDIAQAIYDGFPKSKKRKLISIEKVSLKDLKKIDLFIVGSPTQGGRAKESLQSFLNTIPQKALDHIKVAAFDTRIREKEQKVPLRLLMKTIGYAAPKISKFLEFKGGKLAIEPEGFIVESKEGPLAKGELERAEGWAKKIVESIKL